MTVPMLALAGMGLATVVSPAASRLLSKLPARAQVTVAIGSALALAMIPISLTSVILARALADADGAPLMRCGALIAAVITDPLARPDVSTALLFFALMPIGLALGVRSAWRSTSSSRAFIRGRSGKFVLAAAPARIAFTAGLWRPRVVISRGLLASSSERDAEVVLAHEESHRRGRHPLMVFIAECLARGFPLPPLRWASNSLRFGLEAVADDYAARTTGSRELVAEAVAEVALSTSSPAVAFEGFEVRRVRRLLEPPPRVHGLYGALLIAAIAAVLAYASGHAVHCVSGSAEHLGAVQCRLRS